MGLQLRALDEVDSGWGLQRTAIEHPRPVGRWILRFDLIARDRQTQRAGADIQKRRSLSLVHPTFRGRSLRRKAGDLVMDA